MRRRMRDSTHEVEIKLRFDSPEAAMRRIQSTGATLVQPRMFEDNQVFDRNAEPLKHQGKLLRLRRLGAGTSPGPWRIGLSAGTSRRAPSRRRPAAPPVRRTGLYAQRLSNHQRRRRRRLALVAGLGRPPFRLIADVLLEPMAEIKMRGQFIGQARVPVGPGVNGAGRCPSS